MSKNIIKDNQAIDLHIHTTASDGSMTPEEVVKSAVDTGLSAIAITDHDTIDGFIQAKDIARTYSLELVPGIEISTKYHTNIHILGYYVNHLESQLRYELNSIIEERDIRNRSICKLMCNDGIPADYEIMKLRFGPVIGRPHFARILIEAGHAGNVQEAFSKYLDKGQRYFLPRNLMRIERAVDVIRCSGGIPVLAHPLQYQLDDDLLQKLVRHCMDFGLQGIECMYSGYLPEQTEYLKALAHRYGLLMTGGSDFHGTAKPWIQLGRGCGSLFVPYSMLDQLKKRREKESE